MKNDKTCGEVREWLANSREDSSLRPPERLAEHLSACDNCHAYRDALDALPQLFGALRRNQPPADLFNRLQAKANEPFQEEPRPFKNLEPAKPAAGPRVPLFLRAAAGLLGFFVVTASLPERTGKQQEQGVSSGTAELFTQLDRDLLHSPRLDSTPERELLAHLNRLNEKK